MRFTRLNIPDVILVEPRVMEDDRGFFFESYRRSAFLEFGIQEDFVQDNHVASARGVLRGLHYQVEPMAQAKLIRVLRGEVFDVAVDIRKHSPTFGKFVSVLLNAKDKKMIYIPVGFAHGYCALQNGSEVLYKVSNFYSPSHERGIAWDDPAIGIDWPKLDTGFSLSEKDRNNLSLKEAVVC